MKKFRIVSGLQNFCIRTPEMSIGLDFDWTASGLWWTDLGLDPDCTTFHKVKTFHKVRIRTGIELSYCKRTA